MDQIDDELDLMNTFEIGMLRLIAGLNQNLEGCLHQSRHTADHRNLLAKEIRFGLRREG